MNRGEVIAMKKILAVAAICAGVLAFANTNFAQAADQQAGNVASITQNTDTDTQQFSTEYKEDKD